jgi:hypothetical protein
MYTDEQLIARIRARATDPATRADTRRRSSTSLPPPATLELVEATEAALGFPLPAFLRRLYLEIANGGFGPGYGMLALAVPGPDPQGEDSLPATYQAFHFDAWPERLLPLWDWGDAAWSCVDCGSAEGVIVTHDDVVGPTETSFTLRTWLGAWSESVDLWCEIYEDSDAIITNPFTKKPVRTKVRGVARGRGAP